MEIESVDWATEKDSKAEYCSKQSVVAVEWLLAYMSAKLELVQKSWSTLVVACKRHKFTLKALCLCASCAVSQVNPAVFNVYLSTSVQKSVNLDAFRSIWLNGGCATLIIIRILLFGLNYRLCIEWRVGAIRICWIWSNFPFPKGKSSRMRSSLWWKFQKYATQPNCHIPTVLRCSSFFPS